MAELTISEDQPKIRIDRRPLYMLAEEALTELLTNSEAGDQLPSEPALASRLGISRTTLREAIRHFEKRGVIERRPGVGTFVLAPHPVIESGLERLESIETLAARLNLETHMTGLEVFRRAPTEVEAAALQLEESDEVVVLTRNILTGKEPIAFLEDILPVGVLPEDAIAGCSGSVLDILLAHGRIQVTHTRTDLTAEAADKDLAEHLALGIGSPILLLKSLMFSREGNPIDFSHSYFVPGFFKFHVVRRVGEGTQ